MNSLVTLALIVFCGAVICLAKQKEGYRYRNIYMSNRYRNKYGVGYKYRNRYGNYRYKAVKEDSTESQCNQEVNCVPIESPENGQVSIVGDSATFTCNQNYTLCGRSNVTCGNDGQWDGGLPVCIRQDLDTNLTVVYEDSSYYFSSELLNFITSQQFCEYLGGNLVSINSNAEWEFILCVSQLVKAGFPRWNGLINNGTWEWTSGENVSVTYWHPDLLSIDHLRCGVNYNNAWYGLSLSCLTSQYRFICEIKQ